MELVGTGLGTVERKKLEGYMVDLHRMVNAELSQHRCDSRRKLTRVRCYRTEHANCAATTRRARLSVRAEEKRQWMKKLCNQRPRNCRKLAAEQNPTRFTEMSTSRGIGIVQTSSTDKKHWALLVMFF